jgi:hypothetical protein
MQSSSDDLVRLSRRIPFSGDAGTRDARARHGPEPDRGLHNVSAAYARANEQWLRNGPIRASPGNRIPWLSRYKSSEDDCEMLCAVLAITLPFGVGDV